MSYAYNTYTGNGLTTTYIVPFPYLSQTHVLIKVDGVTKTVSTDYIWTSNTAIQFKTAPANGTSIIITRSTSPGSRLVEYTTGASLTKTVLEKDSQQAYFLAQEALDRQSNTLGPDNIGTSWDAQAKRIKNIETPAAADDATTKSYVDTVFATKIASLGSGDVSGPASSIIGRLATWNNTTGTAITDSEVNVATVLRTSATSSIVGNLPAYSNTSGVQVEDSGVPVGDVVRATTAALTTGQVAVADSLKAVKFLANGSDNQVLKMTSGAPGWGAVPSPMVSLICCDVFRDTWVDNNHPE